MLWDINPDRQMVWGYRYGDPVIDLTGELSRGTSLGLGLYMARDEADLVRQAKLRIEIRIGGHQEWLASTEQQMRYCGVERVIFSEDEWKPTGGIGYRDLDGQGYLEVEAFVEKDMFFDIRDNIKYLNRQPQNAWLCSIRLATEDLYESKTTYMSDFVNFTTKTDFIKNGHFVHFEKPISIEFHEPYSSND